MNWRKFKRLPEVEKVEKVEKPPIFQDTPPFSTLNTFSSVNGDLKNATTPPRHRTDTPGDQPANLRVIAVPDYETKQTNEAERRADFCERHRLLIGGDCDHFNVIERQTLCGNYKRTDQAALPENRQTTSPGDQAKALDGCLLWRLIRCGEKIERAAPSEIVGGVTVGDVLRWVSVNSKDLDAIHKERRLLLTCAESLQGAGHFWEN